MRIAVQFLSLFFLRTHTILIYDTMTYILVTDSVSDVMYFYLHNFFFVLGAVEGEKKILRHNFLKH